MKKKNSNKILIVLLLCTLFLSACYSAKEKEYYVQKDNYVNASGTIRHIAYNDDGSALYLGFSELSPTFDDNSFKIVGDNLAIVQKNNIDEKIKMGDKIEFITAPRYFGDGYVMPIVAVSVNGEELLEFEEGYANLLKWLGVN
ncbi:MAG: hypothetical protein K2H41_03575 [Acetatifactor sp.]|nr:hypothetical protein [Acetatifactor sp.]